MSVWAILLSGGSGTRMGSAVNKTLLPLAGECALCRSLRTLRRHCDGVALVMRPGDEKAVRQALADGGLAAEAFAYGGADRQASVCNGLQMLPEDCDIVLVHDGARPLLDDGTVENVIQSVRLHGSGIASTPVTDTIKQVDDDWIVKATPDRRQLRAVQTPQGFRKELLLRAHREIQARYTDDAALVAALGVPVYLCAGSPKNIKLTTPEDKNMAEFALQGMPRVGHGYDAHRLGEDRRLILGGVEVPYEKGLLGHSDADVLVHAVIDALLGAAALGDIGQHFPDKDPQYKGISSILLLKETARILQNAGFAAHNVDATLIAQRPKLAAYIPQMRQNIADALGLELGRVSVKATTTEGMGFEGTGEGISAHAVALVYERS
ncbi:MAG: 2-C-methyl-D-erythritol 2,4-cyclodiphosphate synthase [Clostridia bacterium]|nr:2-C-methyl-D-erythritol 2,4-cyclodiphosphate synthase [Clostridia bacterium]